MMIENVQTADSVPVARTPLPALRLHEDWLAVIWFALAFVAIGLEARVSDLLTLDEGRPLVAFVLAQTFNVA